MKGAGEELYIRIIIALLHSPFFFWAKRHPLKENLYVEQLNMESMHYTTEDYKR